MKLSENKYTDKDGNQRVTYKIGKMNEFGEGIVVDEQITFVLSFPPRIQPVTFFDKKTNQNKTFQSVNILATCDKQFDNVVLHEQYNNAAFSLPEKYAQWIKDCQKDDSVTVWLRSFEDNEGKKKATWDCAINGQPVNKGGMNEKVEAQETVKDAVKDNSISKEVQATNEDAGTPSEQAPSYLDKLDEWEFPAEIKAWAEDATSKAEDFKEAFPTLKEFVEYVESPDCDTDYFKGQQDGRATVAKTYYKIRKAIGY